MSDIDLVKVILTIITAATPLRRWSKSPASSILASRA